MLLDEAVWPSRPGEPALRFSKGPSKRQPSPAGLGARFPNIVRAPEARHTFRPKLHQYSILKRQRSALHTGCASIFFHPFPGVHSPPTPQASQMLTLAKLDSARKNRI